MSSYKTSMLQKQQEKARDNPADTMESNKLKRITTGKRRSYGSDAKWSD